MRLRYLIGIWVLGALIGGFIAGQIVEREIVLKILSDRAASLKKYHPVTTPAKDARGDSSSLIFRV